MPYVSLIIEALRARPATVFWIAALAQAMLWTLVPALFYASPPGDLPEVIAIGREWQPGSWHGPPLAFWLCDLAFRAAGGHVFGVYILSQICVVTALWALFTLGRLIVGAQHAVMATLLMTGVIFFTAPTPEFGPAILALPLWALALKHYWFALGEGRKAYWLALAVDLGLLLLTTYWGILLAGLLATFTLATRQGRAALAQFHPWAAASLVVLIQFPHLSWLSRAGAAPLQLPVLDANAATLTRAALLGAFLIVVIVAAHFGLGVLALLASGAGLDRRIPAPQIERPLVQSFAARFVFTFALAPIALAALMFALLNRPLSSAWGAVFVAMSGLAVVVAATNPITLHRQNILGVVWFALLIVPPAAIVIAALLGPWTFPYELNHQQPAAAIGQFFTETFRRRVGKPLDIVVGDSRPAYLLTVSSPDRPRIFSADAPARTPWLSAQDVQSRGAIVVWALEDATGQAPEYLRERFPDLVPEVPRTFARPVPGILPSYRVGWAVIRPQAAAKLE
jgi:hypothetical protein